MSKLILGLFFALAIVACGGSDDGDGGGAGGSGGGGGAGGSGGGGGSSAPAAPSSLTGMPMDGGFHLTWVDESANEEAFVVERRESGGDYGEIARLGADQTNHHDSAENLAAGTTYEYRVGASNAAGVSYSNELSFTK